MGSDDVTALLFWIVADPPWHIDAVGGRSHHQSQNSGRIGLHRAGSSEHQELGRHQHNLPCSGKLVPEKEMRRISNQRVVVRCHLPKREGNMLQSELFEAYRNTDYHVFGDTPLVLQPGLFGFDADRFLHDQGVETAIVLTAWNPKSVATATSQNEAAQARLISDLDQRGLAHIPAEGRGRDGLWPPEPSLLILDVPLHFAQDLAAAYQQTAFLFLRRGTAPEVIVTET